MSRIESGRLLITSTRSNYPFMSGLESLDKGLAI